MNVNLSGLVVEFDHIPSDRLIEEWKWLIGDDKIPILISVIGDMFVKDKNNKVYWLEVGGGQFSMIANDIAEFEGKLLDANQIDEWFMTDLVASLKNSDKALGDLQLYSFRKLPILGGDYVPDNFAPLDIASHFEYTGHIHKQIKDLPDGASVEIKIVP